MNPQQKNLTCKWATVAVMVLVAAACTGLKDRRNVLEDTLRGYERAVRWGQYEQIKHFMEDRQRNSVNEEKLKQIRVSSYLVQSSSMSDNKKKLVQTVEIKYYFLDQMTVKSLKDKQVWQFDGSQGRWQRSNPFPKFL